MKTIIKRTVGALTLFMVSYVGPAFFLSQHSATSFESVLLYLVVGTLLVLFCVFVFLLLLMFLVWCFDT